MGRGCLPKEGLLGLACANTSISSSVHTFLSIFRLRTLVTPGPKPRCSPASEMSRWNHPVVWVGKGL